MSEATSVPGDEVGGSAEVDGPPEAAGGEHPAAVPEPGEAAVADLPPGEATVEGLVDDLERLSHERDGYLDQWRRTQADFDNYRKRIAKQQADALARAAEGLVDKLLPVLDACDGAITHGEKAVEPVFASLLGVLEREGLERIDPGGEPFDPNRHEAVLHEPADGDEGGSATVVSDVMRPGYAWKGRLVRPAMVKVKG